LSRMSDEVGLTICWVFHIDSNDRLLRISIIVGWCWIFLCFSCKFKVFYRFGCESLSEDRIFLFLRNALLQIFRFELSADWLQEIYLSSCSTSQGIVFIAVL
jgi:hypothetical protein